MTIIAGGLFEIRKALRKKKILENNRL